jgi:GNAT superfamily N-acetyltransferase
MPYFCAMASRSAAVSVRGVRPGDVGRLQAIQLAAGDAFRHVGMSAVAESPPLPAESLSGYRQAGRAWVAVDDHDEPVGFVVADVVDRAAYIEQVSVHPAHARQRIGAMLLDHVAGWAARHSLSALTLITFRGVPWNAPYYERLGFRELAEDEVTPGLAALWAAGPRSGPDSPVRVCMRRELTAGSPPVRDANS